MRYRRPISKFLSRKIFSRSARRVDVRNFAPVPTRGGIRL